MQIKSYKIFGKRHRTAIVTSGDMASFGSMWPYNPDYKRMWHFQTDDKTQERTFEVEVTDTEMLALVTYALSNPDFRAKVEAKMKNV